MYILSMTITKYPKITPIMTSKIIKRDMTSDKWHALKNEWSFCFVCDKYI